MSPSERSPDLGVNLNKNLKLVFVSVEAINISTKYGILKVAGTVVCVSGAVLMALYRGPSLISLGGTDAASESVTVTPAERWLASTMLEFGVGTCQLGVLCLIAHCFLVGAYLVIQVMQFFRVLVKQILDSSYLCDQYSLTRSFFCFCIF